MVSKEKRQLYNKRYYAKKTLHTFIALNTIDEKTDETTEPLTSDLNKDNDIKHVYEPHILERLFFRVFYIIQFNFTKWFKL